MTGICLKASSETLTLYFYGELEPEASAAFARHAASCEACAAALAELNLLRNALAPRADVRRPDAEWDRFMGRLAVALDRVDAGAAPGASRSAVSGPAVQLWRPAARLSPWLPLAAVLVLAIGLGLVWQRQALETGAARTPAVVAGAPEAAALPLDRAANRHFERAKLVVLGLAMKDPAEAGAGDWDHERALAAELLPQTRLFRLSALDRGETALADLLGDLETVLLQASMTSDVDRSSLERLQRVIRRRDLLVRIDLQDNTVRGL